MLKIIFFILLQTNAVTPQDYNADLGREMYYFTMHDNTAVEYAYEEEVINYFLTGKFEYNEDLGYNKSFSRLTLDRYDYIAKHH